MLHAVAFYVFRDCFLCFFRALSLIHIFSPSELVARVDAVYRRVALAQMRDENNFKEEIRSGDFALNLRNRTLMKRGAPIELTQVEFQIMEYFFSNPGTALDRSAILKHVWGEAYYGEEKDVYKRQTLPGQNATKHCTVTIG